MKFTTLLGAAAMTMAAATTATAQSPASTTPPAPPAMQREAQTAHAMPGMGSARLERLLQGITVPAATRARIDSIYARHGREIPAAAMGERPDSAARAQMQMHLGAADREARALLNPEQQQVFDRNLAAVRETKAMPAATRPQ